MILGLLALISGQLASPPALQIEHVVAAFKSECISDAGIAIGVQIEMERMRFVEAHRARTLAIQEELSSARKAVPFDVDRYAKALKSYNDDQYLRLSTDADYDIKLLRNFSPADRARWAIRLARGYTPPANYCAAK